MEKTTSEQLLGSTAYWTAAVRARENEREDALFHDPWAAALAGDVGMTWIAPRPAESVAPIAIRTRYFDDCLQRITQDEGIRQVVLLAAGLDTRAFRLSWPEATIVFELDQPAVLAYKEEILQAAQAKPGCARRVVGADLREPWAEALVKSGFDPLRPSAWLLEGFLFYLDNAFTTPLLDTVSSLAAPGSWLGFDVINSLTLTSPLTSKWVEMQAQSGAPWVGTMDDPTAFLAQRGWQAGLTQGGAADAHYGRWPLPVIPVTMPNIPHNWFVTARYNPDHNFG
ncbi:MAG: SAM-dependent methyltransferase [Chloroflexota bacterium]